MITRVITKLAHLFNREVLWYKRENVEKYYISSNGSTKFYETPIGKYHLPPDAPQDGIAKEMKQGKFFEPEIIETAKKYIQPGTTVLDIGSNFGQMAIEFSKLAGHVFAFEADDYVFEILQKNIKANDRKNITAVFGAVYNESGQALIFPKQDFKEWKTYGSYGIDPNAQDGRIVKSLKIDDQKYPSRVSFIKIDIQGSDLFALRGAVETIMRDKPTVLFEFEQGLQASFKTSFQDYVDFVNSVNYRFTETIMGINYVIQPKYITSGDYDQRNIPKV